MPLQNSSLFITSPSSFFL